MMVPSLREQFDRVLSRGQRMATSTPNLDKMVEHGAEVEAARSFIEWLQGDDSPYISASLMGPMLSDLLVEWIGVDPKVLDDERRWVARQGQKAARKR